MTRSRDIADQQDNLGGAVAPFVAGKNAIINGDFFVNQRGFTTTTSSGTYGLDRFKYFYTGGTSTYSVQQFTPGTAPVAGYEAVQYARLVTTGQSAAGDYTFLTQVAENPRLFAGQTVTMSFWAKAASGTPKVSFEFTQYFGTGGSPSATVNTYGGQVTLSTSWARYSLTFNVPSVSGKTFGTTANTAFTQLVWWVSAGSSFDSRTGTIGIQSNTFDIWGVQLEAGSVATPFTTASGSIGGELALCQRYCYVIQGNATNASSLGTGYWNGTTNVVGFITPKAKMRTTPTLIYSAASDLEALQVGVSWNAVSAVALTSEANSDFAQFQVTTTGGTNGQAANIRLKALSTAYIGLVAEL